MNLHQYLETIAKRYNSGISSEHSYRADLEGLIRGLVTGVEITNEPSKVTDCGNPDYVITRKKIPVGFIEAKDLGKDLNKKQYKEQFNRYKKALDNLIITDYLWFQFFQHGELVHEIKIGEIIDNTVKPISDNYDKFQHLITNFCTFVGQTIKSSKKLAEMMAAKARLLQVILDRAVSSDQESEENSTLKEQYESFKKVLIHDLKPKEFADIYAQTLAYGMFAARLHDTSLEDFSRQEAAELIPKTNPFLRKLFQYVAGYDIDERIRTTVDNLADVFRATNVEALLKNLGKSTHNNDPIIHFYETFLAEYDSKLRKARGVWYTPESVVKFIVRAVDDLLKSEFGLKDGLADTSKTSIKVKAQGTAITKGRHKGKAVYVDKEVHKIQILDPATGTGTFLAEVVKYIYSEKFKAMQGAWSGYVEDHLIPRLNGFELLMASYSMAHLKLDMLLAETGYHPKKEQRFKIYLTNSLEEYHPDTGTLFSTWLSSEANEANHIKRDTPVMVVLGNPPYSISSSNKGEWILSLIKDYKRDLNEKKINLDDDYIKFIRYGQHLIDKNGEGILAYISNNSFIDGITHRQMRKHLMESFDKIYILDLHGSAKKRESCPDGSKDENVFDIMQGVSINLFIKTKKIKKSSDGEVFFAEHFGSRSFKYQLLCNNALHAVSWQKITPVDPYFFFVPKNLSTKSINSEIYLPELFRKFGNGIGTDRDKLFYDENSGTLAHRFELFFSHAGLEEPFKSEFNVKDSDSYPMLKRRANCSFSKSYLKKVLYRPFDERFLYFDSKLVSRPAQQIMREFEEKNLGLCVTRQLSTQNFCHTFISNKFIDRDPLSVATKERTQIFPLYLYQGEKLELEGNRPRKPNLDPDIVAQIASGLGLKFTNEKEDRDGTFAPIDLLDYIYAVLHSPAYREKYKEFLKIDFPRIPYPTDAKIFWQLIRLGGELRQIHLLESSEVERYVTTYPMDGNNTITRHMTKKSIGYESITEETGRVWINDEQYFDKIPLVAWEFFIGGYQPAQKWLKDRQGRTLSFEDILHYQKIIVALTETDRIMKEIDKIDV